METVETAIEFKSQNPKSKHTDHTLPDLLQNTPVSFKYQGNILNGLFQHWDKDNDGHIKCPDLGKEVIRKNGKFTVLMNVNAEQIFGANSGQMPIVGKEARIVEETAAPAIALEPKKTFDINKRFSFLASLVKMVVKNQAVSAIISGDGGLGKTYTVMGQIKAAGLVEVGEDVDPEMLEEGDDALMSGDYKVIKGFSTAKGLYNTLYFNSDKLIIFDDCDSVLQNDVAVNILKGALDSYDKRVITWNSQAIPGSEIPNSFEFTGRVIFISNMKRTSIPQALISRSTSVDVSMTIEEKLFRIKTVLPLLKQQTSMELKEKAFEVLERWAYHAQDLNFRTMMKIISIFESEEDEEMAKEMAEYMILS